MQRRLVEHRSRPPGAFCSRYRIDRLVRVESFTWVQDAIAREKQLKGWRRERKVSLIEEKNPGWRDLARDDMAGRRSFGA